MVQPGRGSEDQNKIKSEFVDLNKIDQNTNTLAKEQNLIRTKFKIAPKHLQPERHSKK